MDITARVCHNAVKSAIETCMNENMKNQMPIEAPAKSRGKPWKTVKGECRDIAIYRWSSGGRTFYRVLIPGATPPHKTTSNKKTILDLAETLAGVPAHMGPTISGINPELLVKTAEAIKKLEPVLTPLETSVHAGLEEYAQLKARTGKLPLTGLFEGFLAAGGAVMDGIALEHRLGEISAAVGKLAPVLGPLNISIASGIEEYAAVKALAGSQDLRELFSQLLSKAWVEKSRTPIATVLQEFLNARKNESRVSFEYYKTLYYTLGKVAKQLGNIPIGDVTTDDLKPSVFKPTRTPRSNKTYRTNVRTFFKWCQLHQYLDYAQPTAADRLEKIRVAEPAPRVITVAEARAMLTALDDPWSLLYLALSLFTGIRHDELLRLTFDLIKQGSIVDVSAEISKTKGRRTIPIQPVLEAWLAPFYGRSGLVIPVSDRQLKVRMFLEHSNEPGLPAGWERNWLRQSYCSYRLAQTGEVTETAQEDGHYAYVLERVYLDLSQKADAQAYFSLTPEACGKPGWYEKTKAFLKDMPEVHVRIKRKRKAWKKIGDEPAAVTTQPAAPVAAVLPEIAQTPVQVGIQQAA